MDQIQINVSQTPGVVLGLGHGHGVLFGMVVVPQLGGDEDVFALDQPFVDGALDALPGLMLVLVVVCAIEQTVADFDRLERKKVVVSFWSMVKLSNCALSIRPFVQIYSNKSCRQVLRPIDTTPHIPQMILGWMLATYIIHNIGSLVGGHFPQPKSDQWHLMARGQRDGIDRRSHCSSSRSRSSISVGFGVGARGCCQVVEE